MIEDDNIIVCVFKWFYFESKQRDSVTTFFLSEQQAAAACSLSGVCPISHRSTEVEGS